MVRTETVRMDPVSRGQCELRLMGDRVSRLWNAANYVCRQAFLTKAGVPVGAELERRMKGTPEYRQLPSDIAQEVLKKLSEAWKSYFKLRARWNQDQVNNHKPSLPAYRKDRRTGERAFDLIPIKHPRSYSVDPKDCHIVLPRDRRRSARDRLHVAYRGRRRFEGKMGRAEVRYDRMRQRWYLAWSVGIADPKPLDGDRPAAIDLGVRIGASLSIAGMAQALHFENREAMKDWDFLGREIAREQQALAGTRGKETANRAPSSRHIARLHQLRRHRLDHAIETMAKTIAQHCAGNGVTKVYIGWPKHILRDVTYGSSVWAGRIHNFWSFARMSARLQQALEAVGIASERVGERGSSSSCSYCGSKRVMRHPRWRIRCRECGQTLHADQSGSRVILRDQRPSVCWAGAEAAPLTETRRWTRHCWELRSANPRQQVGNDLLEFLNATN